MYVERIETDDWIYYVNENSEQLNYLPSVGKWLLFFRNSEIADGLCHDVVEQNLVSQAKYGKDKIIACCLYTDQEDFKSNMELIEYLLHNSYIPKNKDGKYKNIAYKLNDYTAMGISGSSDNLSSYVDLKTGDWNEDFIREHTIKQNATLHMREYLNENWGNQWALGFLPLHKEDVFDYEIVKKRLVEQNISKKDLERKLIVSNSTINNWFSGRSRPRVWNAMMLCELANLDYKEVIHSVCEHEIE